jgi:hypothetical protein
MIFNFYGIKGGKKRVNFSDSVLLWAEKSEGSQKMMARAFLCHFRLEKQTNNSWFLNNSSFQKIESEL